MARRRMIDPGIWDDPDFGDLGPYERLLYIGMFSNADDEGRLFGDPRYLAKTIFGYDSLPVDQVRAMRDTLLATFGKLRLYVVNEREYLCFANWDEHQSISHPTKSQLPKPLESFQNDSGNPLESSQNDSGMIPGSIVKYSIDKISISEKNGADALSLEDNQRTESANSSSEDHTLDSPMKKAKARIAAIQANGDVIASLAKAYAEGMGWDYKRVAKITVHSSWASLLLELHSAGYTPDDLRACTAWKRDEPYWRAKTPSMQTIASSLPEWLRLGKPVKFGQVQDNGPPIQYSKSELERMAYIDRDMESRKVGKATTLQSRK